MKTIKTPLSVSDIQLLHAGNQVAIDGIVYTVRDIAHKRLCDCLAQNEQLPFDTNGACIYYVGPTPAKPGQVIGSAGPTTSSRMDPFSPALYKAGVKATIGKGYRGPEVMQSLKQNTAVHFAAIGGAGALLSKHIVQAEIIAYDDLGTEAIRKLVFQNFPVVVAYDCFGNSVYK